MMNTDITYTRRYFFYGHTIDTTVTKDPDAVNAWINETENIYRNHRGRLIVGLDTEWRPSYQPGVEDPVAILQLCVDNRCLVFQIFHSWQFPPLSLVNFLNNPNNTFTGVGIETDVRKLVRCGLGRGPNCRSFASDMVNIQQVAVQKFGWSMDGLNMKVLARDLLGIPAEPENVRISAWDDLFLTDEQVRYASKDAFLSSEMGKVLLTEYYSFS